MLSNRRIRVSSALLALVLAALPLAGCVNGEAGPATVTTTGTVKPRLATYDCGGDRSISIENAGASVRITNTEGDSIELPASPPDQDSRYGADLFAIVIDGNEALFMKSGEPPISCRR
jgi:hypothetical protein